MLYLIELLECRQLIQEPARATPTTCTTIDYIYSTPEAHFHRRRKIVISGVGRNFGETCRRHAMLGGSGGMLPRKFGILGVFSCNLVASRSEF